MFRRIKLSVKLIVFSFVVFCFSMGMAENVHALDCECRLIIQDNGEDIFNQCNEEIAFFVENSILNIDNVSTTLDQNLSARGAEACDVNEYGVLNTLSSQSFLTEISQGCDGTSMPLDSDSNANFIISATCLLTGEEMTSGTEEDKKCYCNKVKEDGTNGDEVQLSPIEYAEAECNGISQSFEAEIGAESFYVQNCSWRLPTPTSDTSGGGSGSAGSSSGDLPTPGDGESGGVFDDSVEWADGSSSGRATYVYLENPIDTAFVPTVFGNVIATVMGLVGSIALLVFVYGGFMWLTAAGNPEHVKKGTQAMIWAGIGLFIIFSSYAIIYVLLEGLGVA